MKKIVLENNEVDYLLTKISEIVNEKNKITKLEEDSKEAVVISDSVYMPSRNETVKFNLSLDMGHCRWVMKGDKYFQGVNASNEVKYWIESMTNQLDWIVETGKYDWILTDMFEIKATINDVEINLIYDPYETGDGIWEMRIWEEL